MKIPFLNEFYKVSSKVVCNSATKSLKIIQECDDFFNPAKGGDDAWVLLEIVPLFTLEKQRK